MLLTIPAGSTSVSGAIPGLAITDDGSVEGPERLTLGGTDASGAAVSGSLAIVDDDAVIDVLVSPAEVLEQAAAQQIGVTARFRGETSALTAATAVTVTLAGAQNGATLAAACPATSEDACTDQANNQFTISIPAGSVEASGSFMLTARSDNAADNDEDLTVSGAATIGGEAAVVGGDGVDDLRSGPVHRVEFY